MGKSLTTPLAPDIRATFLIAFTVRCGSNYFCDCLKAAGCGQPTEFFQFPFGIQNQWLYQEVGAAPDDFRSFLPRVINKFSQHGIFGAKLSWMHRNVLEATIAQTFPDSPTIDAVFGHPLWLQLTRRDKIGQAISFWRAIKSGKWVKESEVDSAPPPYSFLELFQCLADILSCEYQWTGWFERCRIRPLVIVYEEFLERKNQTIFQVVQRLQERSGAEWIQSAAAIPPAARFKIQKDTHTNALRQEFIEDLQSIDVPGHFTSSQITATGLCA